MSLSPAYETTRPDSGNSKQRICFCLKVKPERLAEYRRRHREVWPEMLEALHRAGWENYSLFLREDGLLIGYFETADFDHALAAMSRSEVNRRWQQEMSAFFDGDPGLLPDQQIRPIPEAFHLP